MEFWRTYKLDESVTYHWRLGLVDLWVQREGDEWRVASETAREGPEVTEEADERNAQISPVAAETHDKPDDVPWRRVLTGRTGGELELLPAMPDRPLVVRPESPLVFSHRAKAVLYVSIPVWIMLREADGEKAVVAEIPTVTLSNTWFGDPTAGELSYSLSTRARRSPSEGAPQPHRAICQVTIRNNSEKDLPFARLCLPVGGLAVYEGKDQLATSEIEITYQAEEQLAKTRALPGAPKMDGVGALLCEPRKSQRENVLRRGLMTLRTLTGF